MRDPIREKLESLIREMHPAEIREARQELEDEEFHEFGRVGGSR